MNEELERLYAELEAVRNCPLDYLPTYGFAKKNEIIPLIEEDIAELEEEIGDPYASLVEEEEIEDERMRLCVMQGIPRYC